MLIKGLTLLIVGVSLCLASIEARTPTIHVIGDSHSTEFAGISGCVIHWLGPITMHRVGRDGIDSLFSDRSFIRDNDVVVFCFGEIDARCHIGKERDLRQLTQEEVIDSLVLPYVKTIANFRKYFENILVVVYSVTPPSDMHYNVEFPRYGNSEDRVQITQKLNAKLIEVCRTYEIPFIDVYDDYADNAGLLKLELSDGNVHINNVFNQAIKAKLQQVISLDVKLN